VGVGVVCDPGQCPLVLWFRRAHKVHIREGEVARGRGERGSGRGRGRGGEERGRGRGRGTSVAVSPPALVHRLHLDILPHFKADLLFRGRRKRIHHHCLHY